MARLAYHYVSPSAMDAVLEEGLIRAGISRIFPEIWSGDCIDHVRGLVEKLSQEWGEPDDTNVQALGDLAQEAALGLERWQEESGITPTERRTTFVCWDLLAGDLGYVFLSIGDWIHWAEKNLASGAVFDAEDLVRRGATVRPEDFGRLYGAAIREVMKKPFMEIESAKSAILEALYDVRVRNELRGAEAIGFLRDPISKEFEAELVWRGDLPLDFAVEIWKDGKKIRKEERERLEGVRGHLDRKIRTR